MSDAQGNVVRSCLDLLSPRYIFWGVLQLTNTDIMVEGVAANSPTGVRRYILMARSALVAAAVFALALLRRR